MFKFGRNITIRINIPIAATTDTLHLIPMRFLKMTRKVDTNEKTKLGNVTAAERLVSEISM
jgi:hypothetical protein